jgi:hypothetical protein
MYEPGKDPVFVNWDGTCDRRKALSDTGSLGVPVQLHQRAVMSFAEAYYKERVHTYSAGVPTAPLSGTPAADVVPTTVTGTQILPAPLSLDCAQEDVVMRVAVSSDGMVKVRLQVWQQGLSRLRQMHMNAWEACHRDFPRGFTIKRRRGGQNVVSDISFMAAAHFDLLRATPAPTSPSPSASPKTKIACIRRPADVARAF